MHLYESQFESGRDFPAFRGTRRYYVIASTPRSGSHMLGHMLRATGRFGDPLEYLHDQNLARWKTVLETDSIAATLDEVERRRTSPNGVFGLKAHHEQLRILGGFDAVAARYPDARYLLIRREDLVKQAVSLSIATQTGVFISGQKSNGTEATYDPAQIDRLLRGVIRANASWRYLFAVRGIDYLDVTHESLIEDGPAVIRRVAEFTGIEIDEAHLAVEPATTKQSTSRNDDWAARFVREHGRDPLFEPATRLSPRAIGRKLARRVGRMLRRAGRDR